MKTSEKVIKTFDTISNGKFNRPLDYERIHEHTKIPKLEIMDICEELTDKGILVKHEQNKIMILYSLSLKGEEIAKNL